MTSTPSRLPPSGSGALPSMVFTTSAASVAAAAASSNTTSPMRSRHGISIGGLGATPSTTLPSSLGASHVSPSRQSSTISPSRNRLGPSFMSSSAATPVSSASAVAAAAEAEVMRRTYAETQEKERLLRESQDQVRELLRFKETHSQASMELQIAHEKIRTLEAEVARSQKLLGQERDDREATVRHLTEKAHATGELADSRLRRADERLADQTGELQRLREEVERKERMIRAVDEEHSVTKRELQDEKRRHEETKVLLTKSQADAVTLEAKNTEALRSSVKTDATVSSLQAQVKELQTELQRTRDEADTLKRRKNELLVEHSQISSQREILQDRVKILTEDLTVVPQLRAEVTALSTARDEAIHLRHSMEQSEIMAQTERSQRRTLELEREQSQLMVRSLETDLRRLEGDLSKAQSIAQERAVLQHELTEVKDSLEVSHRTVMQLQEQLAVKRDELAKAIGKHESYQNAISGEFALLRQSLEAAVYAPQTVTTHIGAGTTTLNSSLGSAIPAAANTQPPSANISLDAPSSVGITSADASPARNRGVSLIAQHSIVPSCEALFTPVRASILEVATTIAEERSRKANLQRLLEVEQSSVATLEEKLRVANRTVNEQTTQLHDLTRKEAGVTEELQEAKRAAAAARSHETTALATIAGILGTDDVADLAAVQQHVTRLTNDGRALRVECDRLNGEVQNTTGALALERQARAADNQASENRRAKEVADLQLESATRMKEAAEVQNSLKDAIANAAKRHEDVVKEIGGLQETYRQTLEKLAETQSRLERTEADLRSAEGRISDRDGELQEKRDVIARTESKLAEESESLRRATDELLTAEKNLQDEKENAETRHELLMLAARAAIGYRETARSALRERNAVLQLSHAQDQALRQIADEAPDAVRVRKTLRVAAIAVLANNRFGKMLAAIRVARHSSSRMLNSSSRASSPARSRTVGFTADAAFRGKVNEVPLPIIGVVQRNELPLQLFESEQDSVRKLLAEIESFQRDAIEAGLEHPADEGALRRAPSAAAFAVVVGEESPLSRTKSLLHTITNGGRVAKEPKVGARTLARQVSKVYATRLQSAANANLEAEKNLNALRQENSALVSAVQAKEAQNQRFSQQIADLVTQSSTMVDKRIYESTESELRKTRSKLDMEKAAKDDAQDRLSNMQVREMKLLSQQNQLQNEARALAMELSVGRAGSPTMQRSGTASRSGVMPLGITQDGDRTASVRSFGGNPLQEGDRSSSPSNFGPMVQSYGDFSRAGVITPGASVTPSASVLVPAGNRFDAEPTGIMAAGSPSGRSAPDTTTGSSAIGNTPSSRNLMNMIRGIDDKISTALRSKENAQV